MHILQMPQGMSKSIDVLVHDFVELLDGLHLKAASQPYHCLMLGNPPLSMGWWAGGWAVCKRWCGSSFRRRRAKIAVSWPTSCCQPSWRSQLHPGLFWHVDVLISVSTFPGFLGNLMNFWVTVKWLFWNVDFLISRLPGFPTFPHSHIPALPPFPMTPRLVDWFLHLHKAAAAAARVPALEPDGARPAELDIEAVEVVKKLRELHLSMSCALPLPFQSFGPMHTSNSHCVILPHAHLKFEFCCANECLFFVPFLLLEVLNVRGSFGSFTPCARGKQLWQPEMPCDCAHAFFCSVLGALQAAWDCTLHLCASQN